MRMTASNLRLVRARTPKLGAIKPSALPEVEATAVGEYKKLFQNINFSQRLPVLHRFPNFF